MRKERNALEQATSIPILVGTPGRVADLIRREHLDAGRIELLIIDEFDKMMELGFRSVMEELLGHLTALRARWLISATEAAEIPAFLANDALRLDYRGGQAFAEKPDEDVPIYSVYSPQADKLDTLLQLLLRAEGHLPCIIFVNYREAVERVSAFLAGHRVPHAAYHGGMEQRLREKALFRFRSQSAPVLVSTDLAARGLDIPTVRSIIHYHLPLTAEIFLHRNGRTTRGLHENGTVYWLYSDKDGTVSALTSFLTGGGKSLPYVWRTPDTASALPTVNVTLYIGRGKRDKVSKGDIVGWLCKQGGLRSEEITRIEVLDHHAYVAIPHPKLRETLTQLSTAPLKGPRT
jgi:superfamily II DNA/RNA helicase